MSSPVCRRRPPTLQTVADYIEACSDRYLVTLTSKRALTAQALTREVGTLFHRVNRSLFGTAYTRKGEVFLATYAAQERTFRQGLHEHVLVGVPNGSLGLKANPCPTPVPELIVSTWASLDDHGFRRADAQDAREIFDLDGAVSYINKTVFDVAQLDVVDFINTRVPPR